jgi:hypothetical protein
MATSTIENTSGGLITDGFVTSNPSVLITSQSSIKMRDRLINSVVNITVSADIPRYTVLITPKDDILWDAINYEFLDIYGNQLQRHQSRWTGIQTMGNGLAAGNYTLIIPR